MNGRGALVWMMGGVAVVILIVVPFSALRAGYVGIPIFLAGASATAGFGLRQLALATTGSVLSVIGYTLAIWESNSPVDPARAFILGLAVVALLDATYFSARSHGAEVDSRVRRDQVRYWGLRGLLSMTLTAFVALLGLLLAPLISTWLAPVALAVGGMIAFVAASGACFTLKR